MLVWVQIWFKVLACDYPLHRRGWRLGGGRQVLVWDQNLWKHHRYCSENLINEFYYLHLTFMSGFLYKLDSFRDIKHKIASLLGFVASGQSVSWWKWVWEGKTISAFMGHVSKTQGRLTWPPSSQNPSKRKRYSYIIWFDSIEFNPPIKSMYKGRGVRSPKVF